MKRFLVIKPSSLGDVLHAFPAASALAEKDGEKREISWMIHPAFSELLDYLPFVKKKIFFDRKSLGKFSTFFSAFFRLFSALREEKYDAVYDFQGLLRSGFFSFLTKSPLRYGPDAPREKLTRIFYNRKMTYPAETRHAVDKLCHMTAKAENIPLPEKYFHLPVLEKYRQSAVKKALEAGLDLTEKRTVIAIAPGARWQSKTWESVFFAKIMQEVHKKFPEVHFLILGSNAEKESVDELKKALPAGIACTDLCGKTTIGELVELIRFAGILICNDSGPMHIAAFTDTIPVAFFGPTDPDLTGPCCKKARVFQDTKLSCIKCFRRECSLLSCHKAIDPVLVADSIHHILTEKDGEKCV